MGKEEDGRVEDLIPKAARGEGRHRPDNGISSPRTNNCSGWKPNSTSPCTRHKSTSPKSASPNKKPHESREKLKVKCLRIRTSRRRETKNSSRTLTTTKRRSIPPCRERRVVKASKRPHHRRSRRGDQQLVKFLLVWHPWRTRRRRRRNLRQQHQLNKPPPLRRRKRKKRRLVRNYPQTRLHFLCRQKLLRSSRQRSPLQPLLHRQCKRRTPLAPRNERRL